MRSRKGSYARRSGRIPRGKVGKYNLAFINHSRWAEDNGPVLGYDNRPGHHHRHYAGAEEKFAFVGGEKLVERLLDEVQRLRN